MSFFIQDALAEAASPATAATAQDGGLMSFVMIGAIFVLFYFMLIRPQNKRAKEHRELISKIKKGDEILTSSGLLGKVLAVDDHYVKVSIAEGVEVNMQRGSVNAILPKGTLKSI